jgi:hypothetical protein
MLIRRGCMKDPVRRSSVVPSTPGSRPDPPFGLACRLKRPHFVLVLPFSFCVHWGYSDHTPQPRFGHYRKPNRSLPHFGSNWSPLSRVDTARQDQKVLWIWATVSGLTCDGSMPLSSSKDQSLPARGDKLRPRSPTLKYHTTALYEAEGICPIC